MDEMEELRIAILGKTGVGKSSVGNAILGEENAFKAECSLKSVTQICERAEREINGRRIVVIDTPGIFDTDRSEEDLRDQIISSLVECALGPHIFILVLKVERYTEENQKALQKLLEYFTDSIFPHMILLFTHGEDLDKNIKIIDLIEQSGEKKKSGKCTLKDVTEKCGNRVHVIDNKHWNGGSRVSAALATLEALNLPDQALKDIIEKMTSTPADKTPWFNELFDQADNVEAEYLDENEEIRSNEFQLTQLMKSVKKILRKNKREHYRNEALEEIGKAINEEVENILKKMGDKRETVDMVEIRREARKKVINKLKASGLAVGILLGALLGVGVGIAAPFVLVAGLIRAGLRKRSHQQRSQAAGPRAQSADAGAGAAAGAAAVAGAIAEVGVLAAGAATGIGAGVGAGILFLYGAAKGGAHGCKVAETAGNPKKAADKAAKAVTQKAEDVLKACWNLGNTETGPEYEPLDNSD